jgi:2-methylisocitrate lyase-like PEP mutase family enzyme
MIEILDARGLYCSGFCAHAAGFGFADRGLLESEEMLGHYSRIRSAVQIPMLVDIDTGFTGPDSIQRTISSLGIAGIGACHIEDQVVAKQCGHLPGKQVVDRGEALSRVRLALAAGADANVDIVARTDALGPLGIDEAIWRANAFLDLGAVAVFVDAPQSNADLQRILYVGGAQVWNAAPIASFVADRSLVDGFAVILHPIEALLCAFAAVESSLGLGTEDPLGDLRSTFLRLQSLLLAHRRDQSVETLRKVI